MKFHKFFIDDLLKYNKFISSATTTAETTMETIIRFDPTQYPERILRLIMKKAEDWKCFPSEALTRLFDQLADQNKISPKEAA
jgi:hypothetical protein